MAHLNKPKKPRPDFPLFRHASGQWAKKVRGKLYYFGIDPQAALERWAKVKDDLLAGRSPQNPDALTIKELVAKFLDAKKRLIPAELAQRSWNDYERIGDELTAQFGNMLVESLRPDDFGKLRAKWAKTNGPVSLANNIRRAKTFFNFAWNNELVEKPVRYGDQFSKPSKAKIRKATKVKLLAADEIRQLIDKASPEIKAMILLGINCGLGNSDCARLSDEYISEDWLNYPRPKTGIDRRCTYGPKRLRQSKLSACRSKPSTANHGNRKMAKWEARLAKRYASY